MKQKRTIYIIVLFSVLQTVFMHSMAHAVISPECDFDFQSGTITKYHRTGGAVEIPSALFISTEMHQRLVPMFLIIQPPVLQSITNPE